MPAATPRPGARWKATLLLHAAVLLQRTIASAHRRQQHVAWRNHTIRAAHKAGATLDTLAARTGLSPAHIRNATCGHATSD